MTPARIKKLVRTIPDFPVVGVQFRDITTLLADGEGFAATVDWLATQVERAEVQAVAGMEARGFIFGAAVAARMGLPFLPIRKPGKLPCETIGVDYQLEYGSDRLEMDATAIEPGTRVAIVDDLLATGGTACAATELLRKVDAKVDNAIFVIDLPDLGGRDALRASGITVEALMEFEGE